MRVAKALIGLVVCTLETGCATQDATVRPPAPATVATGYRIWGSPAVVLATPFVDQRPDPSRCGMKKAWSKVSARINCSEPPARWLAQFLAQELRIAGFRVYEREKEVPPGQPVVRIEGFLSQLFVEPDIELHYYVFYAYGHYIPEADLAVRLVARGPHFEAERRFYVKGEGDHNGGGLESNFQLALDNSVGKTLQFLVAAIGELVDFAPWFDAYACAPPRDWSAAGQ
jgi:hypothetical protein